jgi:esterase/lipase superfamily enzyme
MLNVARRFILCAALYAGCANATVFDLCVRGASLEETRTARLQLDVQGADVSAFAPRLGAVLANRRFWDNSAEQVFGSVYDADLCGEEVAPLLQLKIELTPQQAKDLGGEVARGSESGFLAAVDHALGPAPAPQRPAFATRSFGSAPTSKDVAADVGTPVVDANGKLRYHVFRIYYATNRNQTASPLPDDHYGRDRAPLSYGFVNVALPKAHEAGHLEAPSIWRLEFSADPEKHVMLQSIKVMGEDAWRGEIAKRATALDNPGILVFIHGYNTSFPDAALRAGQLAYDLKFAGATVLFSWPSRAVTLEYTADEQEAEYSYTDMKILLGSLSTIAPGTPIYVIAHSMGNRVFTNGFKALMVEQPGKQSVFKQIVLAAPDIDADVFRRDLAPTILGKGPRVTLYASSKDKALMASRDVHGGYRRLGESGENLVVMKGLDTVDASMVSTEFLGHSYFGDSGTVLSDLKYVIRKSLPPEAREQFSLDPVQNAVLVYWRFKGH